MLSSRRENSNSRWVTRRNQIRLGLEPLESRQLLAASPCGLNTVNSPQPYGPQVLSTYASDDWDGCGVAPNGFYDSNTSSTPDDPSQDLPSNAQWIIWQGRSSPVIAGQWIVKLKTATNHPRTRSESVEFLKPLTVSGPSALWLAAAPPSYQAHHVMAAVGSDQVAYVEPNLLVFAGDTNPNDPQFGQLWGLANIGQSGGSSGADVRAPLAWDITTGSHDVVIASFDTGIDYRHEDLADNVWRNPREVPGNGIDDDGNGFADDIYGVDVYYGDSDPLDIDGHGTHTSGTLGAIGNNGVGIAGVTWDVQIMSIKSLSDAGVGSSAAAIQGLKYMSLMKREFGVNIVASNHSWFSANRSQALEDAIAESIDLGITFVAAAGNFASNNDLARWYPASYPLDGIIAVAATDHEDELASFSNYGSRTVDLAAPGEAIYSTLPGNEYGLLNGTSMATPHVTGAVALLKSRFPGASPAQVKSALLNSVDPLESLADKIVSDGRLNVAAALDEMAFLVNTSSPGINEVVFDRPTEFQLEMSHELNAQAISAEDFTVNDVPADDVAILSNTLLRFSFANSPVVQDGIQTMRLAAGAVHRAKDALGNEQLEANFRYDSLTLAVNATTPSSGTLVSTPWSTVDVFFNEEIDPATVDTLDLWISAGHVLDTQITSANSARYILSEFTDEDDNFEFRIRAGSIRDVFGNPSTTEFAGQLELDFGELRFPADWEPLEPRASLAAEREITGTITNLDDQDDFVISLKSGQQFSLVVDQTDSLWAVVEMLAPNGSAVAAWQAAENGAAVWGSHSIKADGEYRLRIRSHDSASNGGYRLFTSVNSIREIESSLGVANDRLENAQILDTHQIARGASHQVVVIGQVADDQDYYRIQMSDGETLSIHAETSMGTRIELLNAADELLAVGASSGGNLQKIAEFTGPAGPYFIRVAGTGEYTLVALRNAGFDDGTNNLGSQAQSIEVDTTVHGYLFSEPANEAAAAALPTDQLLTPLRIDREVVAAAIGHALQVGGDYLVAFNPTISLDQAVTRLSAAGVEVTRILPLFHAAAISLSSSADPMLNASWIQHIERNADVTGQGYWPNDPRIIEQWALESHRPNDESHDTDIDVREAWEQQPDASSVVVAILDTGLDGTHLELAANVWQNPGEIPDNGLDDDGNSTADDLSGYDFVNMDPVANDDNGHGTHLAGIIGATSNNEAGIAGIASGVQLLPVKVLGPNRQGKLSDVLSGLQYALATTAIHQLRLAAVLTSWTTDQPSPLLESAIDRLSLTNTLVVAAAGNNQADLDTAPNYPASYERPALISVAASDRHGQLADFSAFGEAVSIAAPGVDILSTLPEGRYGYMSGTSAASAYVAGAAAVLAAADPTASVGQIKSALLNHVDRRIDLTDRVATGGTVNLALALQSLWDQGDYYRVTLAEADTWGVTAIPVDTELTVLNNHLTIGLAVYTNDGDLLTLDEADSAGTPVTLAFTAPDSGAYILRVWAAENSGPYTIQVTSPRGESPISVLETWPRSGSVPREAFDEIRLHFDDHILVPSFDIAGIEFAGQGTAGRLADANTVVIQPPTSLPPGTYTLSVPENVLTDLRGNANAPYLAQFEIVSRNPDFSGDSRLGCQDLRLLQQATTAGNQSAIHDLNLDGRVNTGDIQTWIIEHYATIPGDANLDRVVDASDWNIWNDHKFMDGQDWCSGDFTGDGAVDAADWSIWHDRKFTASAPRDAVPIPTRTPRAPLLEERVVGQVFHDESSDPRFAPSWDGQENRAGRLLQRRRLSRGRNCEDTHLVRDRLFTILAAASGPLTPVEPQVMDLQQAAQQEFLAD